ncbi:MAG: alkaline phosphatase family protein, partial [bacterium]
YELVGGRGASHQVAIKNHVSRQVWDNRYERFVNDSEERALELKHELDQALLGQLKKAVNDHRVEFAIANLASLDYVGHQHGVRGGIEAYRRTVEKADAHFGEFLKFLDEGDFYDEYTVFIVADHGFTHIKNTDNVVAGGSRDEPDIPELGEAGIEHAVMSRGGSAFSLFIRNSSDVPEAYELIRDKEWVQKIYSEHDLPDLDGTMSGINYHIPPRSGDFFIDVASTHTVGFSSLGQHGSSQNRDRVIPHIFYGSGIAAGASLKETENVDIAPTVLALFGLDYRDHLEADGRVLTEIFK